MSLYEICEFSFKHIYAANIDTIKRYLGRKGICIDEDGLD